MRLRTRKSRGKYYSYEITLPKKLVEALGWKENIELEAVLYINKDIKGILIKPRKQSL